MRQECDFCRFVGSLLTNSSQSFTLYYLYSWCISLSQDNGLVPVWDQTFEFNVSFPELACLSIVVYDEDVFGEPVPMGQCVCCIETFDEINRGLL